MTQITQRVASAKSASSADKNARLSGYQISSVRFAVGGSLYKECGVEFMKGLRAAKSDRLMERQQALGEKRKAARGEAKALMPDSAAAIQPD